MKETDVLKIKAVRTLYHGTAQMFEQISLDKARSNKDFGKGFYLTTNLEQAIEWAESRSDRIRVPMAYVYEYDVNSKEIDSTFKVEEYLTYSTVWLDLIRDCRLDGHEPLADIIYDRMADGRVNDILSEYRDGEIKKEDALEYIQKWKRPGRDQYCFKTEKACGLLSRSKTFILEKDDMENWKMEKMDE